MSSQLRAKRELMLGAASVPRGSAGRLSSPAPCSARADSLCFRPRLPAALRPSVKSFPRAFPLALALFAAAQPNVQAAGAPDVPAPRWNLHWLEHHWALNRSARASHAQLILVGDSIVENFATVGRATWDRYYAPRHPLNLGIGGDRTQHVLWRLAHGNLDHLAPRLVIVMVGQNNGGRDSAAAIGAGVTAIVALLRTQLPQTKILLLAIFPRGEPATPERATLAAASRIAAATADGVHVWYLDVNRAFLRADGSIPRTLMADLEHPTPLGYRVWAEALEPTVARLMGERPILPSP